ncbi:hypothetical protein GCM10009696_36570 [Kocuria himachalensis]
MSGAPIKAPPPSGAVTNSAHKAAAKASTSTTAQISTRSTAHAPSLDAARRDRCSGKGSLIRPPTPGLNGEDTPRAYDAQSRANEDSRFHQSHRPLPVNPSWVCRIVGLLNVELSTEAL